MKRYSCEVKDLRKNFKDVPYVILNATRDTGKSFASKELVIEDNITDDEEFIYLRRFPNEIKDTDTEDYFPDLESIIKKKSKGEYDCISVFRRRIYLAKYDENKNKVRKKKIGYAMALSEMEKKKSLQYPNVTRIIYEEYCTNRFYLNNEPVVFMHFVSSVFRDRKGQCILIGNKMNIFNPYFEMWGLTNAFKQKEGTIDTYRMLDEGGKEVLVKVWHIKKIEETSGMFFGIGAKSIDGEDYYIEPQPKLAKDISKYEVLYNVVVKVKHVMFLMQFLYDKDKPDCMTWYVQPKTSEYIHDGTRVVTSEFTDEPLCTMGFYPLSQAEETLFKFIRQGKIAFASDACGTNFKNAMKELKVFNF